MCKAALPEGIDKDMSVLILVVNVIFPGVGTLIASCLAPKCKCNTVSVGILQLITSFIIVGWVWAIMWSVYLYKKADEDSQASTKPVVPEAEQPQPPQPAVVSPQTGVQQPYPPYPQIPPSGPQQPYPPYAPAPGADAQQPYPPYAPIPPAGPQEPYAQHPKTPPPTAPEEKI